ncbi:hypothetical protein J25TS5_14580 [Paenibacillus faecis]|uniref:XkdQ/YqbQ family protein n=1 Tax=Paenibacillus faecis TaxID=862114 RepID=UPI001B2CC48B|nr:hypothetical protein [Paenibacillus faecis]GIO84526.1 hypothetical protein J25TS5_14580 [Paenibacillus faecis]
MTGFGVVYGKENVRQSLTDAIEEISWSSARDEIARSVTVRLRGGEGVKVAGMLMCFSQRVQGALFQRKNQFFHGPIVKYEEDEFSNAWDIDAREIAWYLSKNKGTRPYLKGKAGTELQRYIQSTGIDFRCPELGFNLDERYGTMTLADIVLDVLQKAYERSGYRYHVDTVRTDQSFYLQVVREGTNTTVPIFIPEQMESSTTGYSIEDTYTVVTAEKYKDDKLVSSVTKINTSGVKSLGRMQEIIEVQEDESPVKVAEQRLKALSSPKQIRKIKVRHSDHTLAGLRAGWLVLIQTDHISKWIVESVDTTYKNGIYMLQMELERRE